MIKNFWVYQYAYPAVEAAYESGDNPRLIYKV